jgi:electron transfer flavoprotein beta subunit
VNIIVLIKQVPDTVARIQDRVRNGTVDLEGVPLVVNPYDEYAVEEALRQREKHGGAVTLLSLGPERVQTALKDMLALGADEGIQLWDPAFPELGARGVAAVLAAAIRRLPHDMIWAGWKGVDDDQGVVPIYVARALGYPHASYVSSFEVAGGVAHVASEVEGGKESLDVRLPAVFTAQKGLNEVRYASLKGIMAVKRKVIPIWGLAELGIDAASLPQPAVRTDSIQRPPDRPPGRILEGTTEERAHELVRLLHEEAKVI